MRSRLRNLGYATHLSTGASREAPVDNEWLCNLGYAIHAVRSRLCNLGYATRSSTGASREAPVDNEWLCNPGYAIYAVRSRLCNLGSIAYPDDEQSWKPGLGTMA